jgi:hypothetical protein
VRDEIQRISKLVAEGKLSPEDAADLIDAFYASERNDDPGEPVEEAAATTSSSATPPPPPSGSPNRDPLKQIIESIEKLTKEGAEAVNWSEVSRQARQSAKKGFDALKTGLEEISKGKGVGGFGWFTSGEVKEVSLPLSIPVGKTLKVENACGDVKIVGGFDVGTATARARFKGASAEDAKAKAEAYTLIIEESDHMVLIRQPDVSGLHVDVEIQMPGTGNVEARVETGDIQILDTRGTCRVFGRSGDVRLRGLDGVVEITGENGDISVEDTTTPSLTIENKNGDINAIRIKGNVNARSASGDVHLSHVAGKTVAVESVSGSILVEMEEPVTGTLNIRTVNGDVKLTVPDGNDCRVSLSTLRGDVSCDLDLEDKAKQEQRITGRLGAGTGTLDVSAVTGDVSVEMRNTVTA